MSATTTSGCPPPTAQDGAADTIRAIWERRRGEVLERVDVVDEAIAALLGEARDDELRASAHRAAHKLAGAGSTFGFPRASELARELELARPGRRWTTPTRRVWRGSRWTCAPILTTSTAAR